MALALGTYLKDSAGAICASFEDPGKLLGGRWAWHHEGALVLRPGSLEADLVRPRASQPAPARLKRRQRLAQRRTRCPSQ